MSPTDIKALLVLMKEFKVAKLKMADLELELHPLAFAPTLSDIQDKEQTSVGAPEGMPTEQDFLFMSAGEPPSDLDVPNFQPSDPVVPNGLMTEV